MPFIAGQFDFFRQWTGEGRQPIFQHGEVVDNDHLSMVLYIIMHPEEPAQPPDPQSGNILTTTPIGSPAPWLIEAAAAIGLDYSGLVHAVTNHFRSHAMNRHPDIQPEDFEKIPAIITAPDTAIIGAVRFGFLHNAYVKRIDGTTYIYIDEVLVSRKNKLLRSVTMYKNKLEKTLEEVIAIIKGSGRTDVSKSKIIGAGGRPGGEAEETPAHKQA